MSQLIVSITREEVGGVEVYTPTCPAGASVTEILEALEDAYQTIYAATLETGDAA